MRIFVSSTFLDLQEYRAAAIRGLQSVGHDVVAMETFTASTAPPIQRVIEKVDEAEAYVGIFAWRYGYVPLKADCVSSKGILPPGFVPGATSITHLEYLRAKETKKEILAFLLDEQTAWPPVNMDAHTKERVERTRKATGSANMNIDAIRSELRRNRIIASFTSPADLEARVIAAVTNVGMGIGLRDNLASIGRPVHGLMDSSHGTDIDQEIQEAMSSEKRFTTIDLATEWWSTRLFQLAVLAANFTEIERIVIVRGDEFIGMVSVHTVLRRLAAESEALARFAAELAGTTADAPPDEALDRARKIWSQVFRAGAEAKAKTIVSEPSLTWWFDDAMFRQPIAVEDLEDPTILDLTAILSYPNDFVPVVSTTVDAAENNRLETIQTGVQVVDKRSLNAQFSHLYVTDLMKKAKLV